jgi:hypothetical protein
LGGNAEEVVQKLLSFAPVLDPTFKQYFQSLNISLNSSIEKIISYVGVKNNIYNQKDTKPRNIFIIGQEETGEFLNLTHGIKVDILKILEHKAFLLELLFIIHDLFDIVDEERFKKEVNLGSKKEKASSSVYYQTMKKKVIFYVSFVIWVDKKIIRLVKEELESDLEQILVPAKVVKLVEKNVQSL